jgi:hypothetical protein
MAYQILYLLLTFGLGSLVCFLLELIWKYEFYRQSVDSLEGWSARRKAASYTGQHKHKKRGQTSMPRVEFEPTIPVLERAKTFHALERAATVIGKCVIVSVDRKKQRGAFQVQTKEKCIPVLVRFIFTCCMPLFQWALNLDIALSNEKDDEDGEGYGLLDCITSCSSKRACRFGGTYRIHLQNRREKQPAACFCWFLACLTLRPWRWRRYVAPKSQLTFAQTTRRYIVENKTLHNLKSFMIAIVIRNTAWENSSKPERLDGSKKKKIVLLLSVTVFPKYLNVANFAKQLLAFCKISQDRWNDMAPYGALLV